MSPRGIEPWSLDLKPDVLLNNPRGQRNFGRKNFSNSTSHFLLYEVYYEKFFLPKFLCPQGVVSSASDFKSRDQGSIPHGTYPQKIDCGGFYTIVFWDPKGVYFEVWKVFFIVNYFLFNSIGDYVNSILDYTLSKTNTQERI